VPALSVSPAQDSDTLRALEIALIRLKASEERGKLLEDRLAAKDTQIEAYKGLVEVKDEQITLLKSANQDRAALNTGDARMLQSCEQQLSRADAEIARLRSPSLFKRLFSAEFIGGAAVGYGVRSLQK
jgi:hypothetical protein